MSTNVKNYRYLTIPMMLLAMSGCSKLAENSDLNALGINANSNTITGSVSMNVYNTASKALVYSDAAAGGALKLTQGVPYNLKLSGTNVAPGTAFSLQATNIDVVAGNTATIAMQLGDNMFVAPSAGDYVMKLVAPGASVAPKSYQASVSCANPNFTAASLQAGNISVSPGAGSNLYNFSAAGVTSGANGQAPYLCAFDLTGVGIRDTAFADCGSTATNQYVNLVGSRNVGVIVKDSCNTTYTVSKVVNLAYSVPSKPGNVFIFGQNSASSGSAVGDARIDSVSYLATNQGGNNIVQPLYNMGAGGSGKFQISAFMNYGMPSSVKYGMQIQLGSISDTLNVSASSGSVDVSQAVLSKIQFSTDQAGDQSAARTLGSTSCVLSNQGAKVMFQKGTPCSAGTTGDNNSADVEIYADYSCNGVSDSGGSVHISGSFDGIAHLADSCNGGGQGGGGITPISL